MKTIKAAVCHEFGAPLVIEDILLRAPEMGEVEVSLDAVAICHSDISFADGAWGGSLPAVYGHEAAGVVSAIGSGVNSVVIGDSVVVTLIRACGTCISCAKRCAHQLRKLHMMVTKDQFVQPAIPKLQSRLWPAGAFAEKSCCSPKSIGEDTRNDCKKMLPA